MSSSPDLGSNLTDIPGLAPAAIPFRPRRQALGLPAGSVRALLALLVLALLWAVALWPMDGLEMPPLFMPLQYLFILILASYFAAHGKIIGVAHAVDAHPLHLPRGTVRFLLLIGFAGLVIWIHLNRHEFEDQFKVPGYTPLVLLAGFFLGYLVTLLMHAVVGDDLPFLYQDILAWLSLIAALLLGVAFLLQLIYPSLSAELRPALAEKMTGLAAILAAVIGFYFGARS